MIGSAVAMVLMIAVNILMPPSAEEQLQALRAELKAQRSAADSCRAALGREQVALFASDTRLDSLRTEIELFESLDPRGVPTDSYAVYLDVFETYNAGIPSRVAAADSLRIHWTICRAITREHNSLADSARGLAAGLGLLAEDSSPGAGAGAGAGAGEAATADAGGTSGQ